MRIVHLCTSIDPATGGPANVLARLARVQAGARGHAVHVVTADDPRAIQAIAAPLREVGVRIDAGGPPRTPLAWGRGTAGLVDAALDAGPDVVHAHGLWQHAVHHGLVAARRRGIPAIVRTCGMLDPWSLRQGPWRKRIFLALRGRRDLDGAAGLHFTTEIERRLVEPLDLTPPTWVVPNGVDWDEFVDLPPRGRFRDSLPESVGPDTQLVVFLSRVHPKKGLDLLLPAFAESGVAATAHLAIVGPGEEAYLDSLRSEAVDLEIADRVHFCGLRSGSARLEALVDADVFCLPSYQENFGVVVIEALAAGTPVIISDQVNLWPDVEEADCGLVTDCAVAPLSLALRRLLVDDPGLRDRLAARARPWVEANFPWTRIAERIAAMYGEVAAAREGDA